MYGRIILIWIFKEIVEVADWIHLSQDRCQRRALGNRAMNVGFEVLTAMIMKSIIA
jgi:hypothetical protein